MDDFRKLLVLGVNEAIKGGRLSLAAPPTDAATDEDGHFFTTLAGLPSVVLWNSISVGELRVSVWWDYDHSKHPQADGIGNSRESFSLSQPLARRIHYPKFVAATASGWLERKTGKHLQGTGKQGIFDTYLKRGMKATLGALPVPKPDGYSAEGQFFL